MLIDILLTQVQSSFIVLLQVRQVLIERDKPGGLGLSVKGGAEHNLPILVSRIFKDQAGIYLTVRVTLKFS